MDKVLIIEDQIDIAELQKDYLLINNFDVDVETSGLIGMEKALKNNYSLIILDIMLDDTDGFKICKEIRNHKKVPIIFVSARSEDIDKIRGLGLGADDYMTKPFSPQELVARVKAHISRYKSLINTKADDEDIIETPGLRIEISSRRVYKLDSEVILTSKEFDLLLFLASNSNIVFSKEVLFEKLWSLDGYGDLSTIAVHIKRIREKIEIDHTNPKLIETVWGAGYRFKKIM